MTVAVLLLAYAVCAGTLGAKTLRRAGWIARAPLLAIVTYLAAAWSVLAAVGLAGLALAVHATALGGALSTLIGACVLRLRATYVTPGGAAVAWAGLLLSAAVAARAAQTAIGDLRACRRQARRHAQTARLVGRPEPALGAVLVEHSQPAAYCVASRPPTVVMTTAALHALDPAQLTAVLAHERAHLARHHHRLRALARITRQVLPFLPLMRDAEVQVAHLIELHADDTATRSCNPQSLATALVVLATPAPAPAQGPAPAPAPVAATPAVTPPPAVTTAPAVTPPSAVTTAPAATATLAAATTDVVHRIQRLLRPAEPLRGPRRHLLRAAAAGLALLPMLLALAPAVVALALGRLPAA